MSAHAVGCVHTCHRLRAGGHISFARIVFASKKNTQSHVCNFAITRSSPLSLKTLFPQSLSRPTTHTPSRRLTFSEKVALGTVFELGLTMRAGVIKRTKG
jgi:hypothetical protein